MPSSKFLSASMVAVATFAAISATSAFAQRDSELPVGQPLVTTSKARADVRADTLMAKQAGELNQSAHANPEGPMAEAGRAKTRAEVIAEMNAAKQANGGWLP